MQQQSKYLAGLISALLIGSGGALAQAQTTTPSADSRPTLAPPPPASRNAGDLALWRTAYINESGVLPVGATDAALEYVVGGSFSVTSQGTVKGWMRWENFTPVNLPQGVSRSTRQLVEVDCQGGRGRILALDIYPYNNLQGAAVHADAQDPQWTYARPGTVLEQNIGLMCAAARSAVAAAVMQARAEQGPATTLPQAPATSLASLR